MNFLQRVLANAFGGPRKRPNGAITAGRTEAEAAKPVTGNHLFYGNVADKAAAYRQAAANRAMVENTLRKASDPHPKAERVAAADERF